MELSYITDKDVAVINTFYIEREMLLVFLRVALRCVDCARHQMLEQVKCSTLILPIYEVAVFSRGCSA